MEKITLRVFWICLLSCASCVIVGIWLGDNAPETLFKVAATLFIIGLANFLIWTPLMTLKFLHKLS